MTKKNRKTKSIFDLIESRMTPASIRRSDAKAHKMLLTLRLAEFRKAMNKDQSSVRGFTQPAVSKIEGRGDIRLSTLVEYCHGLGAELRITAYSVNKGPKSEFVLLEAS